MLPLSEKGESKVNIFEDFGVGLMLHISDGGFWVFSRRGRPTTASTK